VSLQTWMSVRRTMLDVITSVTTHRAAIVVTATPGTSSTLTSAPATDLRRVARVVIIITTPIRIAI